MSSYSFLLKTCSSSIVICRSRPLSTTFQASSMESTNAAMLQKYFCRLSPQIFSSGISRILSMASANRSCSRSFLSSSAIYISSIFTSVSALLFDSIHSASSITAFRLTAISQISYKHYETMRQQTVSSAYDLMHKRPHTKLH